MTIPRFHGAAALASLLALAACGGDQGPSFASSMNATTDTVFAVNGLTLLQNTLIGTFGAQDPSTPAPYFVQASAVARPSAVARALAILDRVGHLADLAQGSPSAGPALRAGAGPATVAMTCVPAETGVDSLDQPIDTDGDGVPDDYTANFGSACSWLANGLVYTLSGSYRIQDTGAGLASFAFTATKFTATLTDGSTGEHLTHALNGTESATFVAASASHAEDFVLTHTSVLGGTTRTITFTMQETANYAVDPGSSFTAGGAQPAGTLEYTGDFRITGLTQSGNFRFLLSTPTSIHYSPACGSGITAGVLQGLLNGAETKGFRFTWSACAAPTLQYFGATT